jgi:cyclic pyranopterin phosphate synthase
MTTNAFLLGRHVDALRDAGLDSVNISLDSLDPETFRNISRIGDLDRVLSGIDSALDAGFRVKLNAVVVRGKNDHEITDLVRYASQRGAIMRFIEFMPIGGDTEWGDDACVPSREMRDRLGEEWELVPDPSRYGSGPARYWRVHGPDTPSTGWAVGIIGAVTECFCADCNRVRITPQGGLRACLADDRENNLRDALRLAPDEAAGLQRVEELIHASLFGKRESHAFDIEGDAVTTKRMHSIGG